MILRTILVLGGLLAFALYAVPLGVLALEAITTENTGLVLALGPRRTTLLLRGLKLAAIGAVLAQVLGGLLAMGWLSLRPRWLVAATTWLALATLLTPSYVLAYALSLPVLPEGLAVAGFRDQPWYWWLATEARALLAMGIWQAPVGAAVLAMGWHQAGVAPTRQALLDAGFTKAVVRGAGRAMLPWLGLSWLLCTTLLIGEFAIPHLSLVQTYNTEILAEVQQHPGAALQLSWPLILVLLLCVVGLALLRRQVVGSRSTTDSFQGTPLHLPALQRIRIVAVALGAVVLLAPWGILLGYLTDVSALVRAGSVFPGTWSAAAQIGLTASILTLPITITLLGGLYCGGPVIRGVAMVGILLSSAWLLLPPIVTGDALLVTYGPQRWLSDRVAFVGFVGALRFGCLMIGLSWLASTLQPEQFRQMAAVDRLTPLQSFWRVRLPLLRLPLLAGAILIATLGLTEVAASVLILPPGAPSLSVTLLNQIHFGRNENVIALCLQALAVVGGISVVLTWLVGRVNSPGS